LSMVGHGDYEKNCSEIFVAQFVVQLCNEKWAKCYQLKLSEK